MKPKLKKALACSFACVFVSLIALSSISIRVNAAWQIFYHVANFDGWARGYWGDYYETAADTSGYFRAYCKKTSYAWARIIGDQVYSGATVTNILIQVTAKNAYVYKDYPWFSKADAKWWVQFIDLTAGTVLLNDKAQDFSVVNGFARYQKSFTATVVGGHTYSVEAGGWVETGYGWFGNYGTAETRGTIDVMDVTGT